MRLVQLIGMLKVTTAHAHIIAGPGGVDHYINCKTCNYNNMHTPA